MDENDTQRWEQVQSSPAYQKWWDENLTRLALEYFKLWGKNTWCWERDLQMLCNEHGVSFFSTLSEIGRRAAKIATDDFK